MSCVHLSSEAIVFVESMKICTFWFVKCLRLLVICFTACVFPIVSSVLMSLSVSTLSLMPVCIGLFIIDRATVLLSFLILASVSIVV